MLRKNNGRNEEPSAGIIDSQSVKGTAESAEESGFDGGKKVKGRNSVQDKNLNLMNLLLNCERH
jgi:putative transposase